MDCNFFVSSIISSMTEVNSQGSYEVA